MNKTQYDWFPGKSQNSKKLKKRKEIGNPFWKIKAKTHIRAKIWKKWPSFEDVRIFQAFRI